MITLGFWTPSGWELIIVLVIVVMIFGLGKLPKAAGQIGKAVGSFRSALSGEDDEVEIGEQVDDPDKLEDQEGSRAARDASIPRGQETPDAPADGRSM